MIDPTVDQYKEGKIYKLTSNQTDDIYIGSTKSKLLDRFYAHQTNYKYQYKYTSAYKILKYEDVKIELIENYPTTSKYFLEVRETELIEQLKCVNTTVPRNKNKYQYDAITGEQIDPTIGEYQQGKIYKLTSSQTDAIYIGSTKLKLSDRFNSHQSSYRIRTESHYITSFDILQYEDVKIELIENYPTTSRHLLKLKEREWISNTACVNKVIPTRTDKEYRDDHKEYYQTYRDEHKEERKEYIKGYQKLHQEELKIYLKKYNEEHREELHEKQKIYIKKNIEHVKAYHVKYNREHKEEKKIHSKQYREKIIKKLTKEGRYIE